MRILAGCLLGMAACAAHAADDDPYEDSIVTCEEMRQSPERVFGGGAPDLGSGHGSPTEVDYACGGGLQSQAFLQGLAAQTEATRAENPRPQCTGSIVHAQWRYHQFDLLEAGLAPREMLRRGPPEWRFYETPEGTPGSSIEEYFERWSYESLHNFRAHRAFLQERKGVTPLLVKHYRRTARATPQEAKAMTEYALRIFLDRAAGSFPQDSVPDNARVLEQARRIRGPAGELDLADDEVARSTLNMALLMQRPAAEISRLVERVGRLDYGDESPLFFALENPANVRLLLDAKADVDYANGFGKTPLFYAVGFNDAALVKLLLSRGADVNRRYKEEIPEGPYGCLYGIERTARTLLMHAAQHADVAMLRLLLERGASLEAVDGLEQNALDYAAQAGKSRNAAYLQSKGLKSLEQRSSASR